MKKIMIGLVAGVLFLVGAFYLQIYKTPTVVVYLSDVGTSQRDEYEPQFELSLDGQVLITYNGFVSSLGGVNGSSEIMLSRGKHQLTLIEKTKNIHQEVQLFILRDTYIMVRYQDGFYVETSGRDYSFL